MMKRVLSILLIMATVLAAFSPLQTEAAERLTIRMLQESYDREKAKYDENQRNLRLTQSEINSKTNRIETLKAEMVKISKEVVVLNEQIEEYKIKIKGKIIESRNLIEQLQMTQKDDLYYDYIFNADSVSDMVYRSAVIKEVVEYNDKMISTLNNMINDNKKREEEIEKRKVEINKLEADLATQVTSLGEKKSQLSSGGVSIAKQMQTIQDKINMYKKKGCKLDDVIGVDCDKPSSNGFRRPTTSGYVTQNAFYNSPSSSHRGLDIGSSNGKREKIYPVADGTIIKIYEDLYHAKCIQIEHNINGTYYTSLYVHLSSYASNIYSGQRVTTNTFLGYMGDTGKAYGVHLHLELYPCRLYTDKQCLLWDDYTSFAYSKLRSGYNPRKLVPVTNGLYNKWNTR